MQAIEFSRAIHRIAADLDLREFAEFMSAQFMDQPANYELDDETRIQMQQLAFNVRSSFDRLEEADPEAYELANAFDLQDTLNENRLGYLLSSIRRWNNANQAHTNNQFLQTYFSVSSFIHLVDAVYDKLESERIGRVPEGHSILELEVADYGERTVRIQRLSDLLNTTSHLYDQVLQVLEIDGPDLRIVALDSGTRPLISLEGAGEAIDAIRRLFGSVITGLRFWENRGQERDWETVMEGLDVLAVIQEHEDQGTLEPETADRLRHNIEQDLRTITTGGGAPKELRRAEENRRLLEEAREQPLLEAGEDTDED